MRILLSAMFVLVLSPFAAGAVCGDGILDLGEECDDGNTVNGDSCSNACEFLGCSLTGTWRDTFLGLGATWSFVEDLDGTLTGVVLSGDPANPLPLGGIRVGTDVNLTLDGSGLGTATMLDCDVISISLTSLTFDLHRESLTVCGDGVLDPEESCDDGNFINGDDCTVACELPMCGNRIVEEGEDCDDGDPVEGNGCSTTCEANDCGNAVLEPGELCDDGNTINGDGCSAICQPNVCGNGVIESGEACDDGNAEDDDSCSALCVFQGCPLTGTWGDSFYGLTWSLVEDASGSISGVLVMGGPADVLSVTGSRVGAQVDLLLEQTVLSTATMSECDALSLSLPSTSINFHLTRQRATVCGDGVVDSEESCDDGNFVNGDGCTVACILPACGNRIVEVGEECDDGDAVDGNGCSTTCEANVCGNGVLEPGEQCDDANTVNGDGCSAICQPNVCGNAVLESGEECDDGNTVSGDTCSDMCQFQGCPLTGTWRAGFLFDLTWTFVESATGALSGVLYWGDGSNLIVLGGARVGTDVVIDVDGAPVFAGTMEDCDVVSLPHPIGSLSRQRGTVCGDGILDSEEACDDGNFVSADDCTVACTTATGCGNGIVDLDEECDDANGSSNDGCVPGCNLNVCGDGHVHVGTESCDDGNTSDGDGCSGDCLTLEIEMATGAIGGVGLTATTDPEGDGATPSDPVETTVSAPVGTLGGTLTITEQVAPPIPPPGFIFMGTLINVTATELVPAPSGEFPLALTFRLDASVIPAGQHEGSIEIRKDGAAVPECSGPAGQALPDPCVSLRERAADQDVLLTVLTSTLSDWDFLGGVCGTAPALDCRLAASAGAKLRVSDRSGVEVVSFQWRGREGTPATLFGDPINRNDYTVCIYDSRGVLAHMTAESSGMCSGRPCWRETAQGYKYLNPSSSQGISRLLLRGGDGGRSRISVKARSHDVALPIVGPVLVQVRPRDGGCFGAIFNAPSRNDATGYKAAGS